MSRYLFHLFCFTCNILETKKMLQFWGQKILDVRDKRLNVRKSYTVSPRLQRASRCFARFVIWENTERDVDVKFNIMREGGEYKSRELYLRLTRLIDNSWMSSSFRDTLFEHYRGHFLYNVTLFFLLLLLKRDGIILLNEVNFYIT